MYTLNKGPDMDIKTGKSSNKEQERIILHHESQGKCRTWSSHWKLTRRLKNILNSVNRLKKTRREFARFSTEKGFYIEFGYVVSTNLIMLNFAFENNLKVFLEVFQSDEMFPFETFVKQKSSIYC